MTKTNVKTKVISAVSALALAVSMTSAITPAMTASVFAGDNAIVAEAASSDLAVGTVLNQKFKVTGMSYNSTLKQWIVSIGPANDVPKGWGLYIGGVGSNGTIRLTSTNLATSDYKLTSNSINLSIPSSSKYSYFFLVVNLTPGQTYQICGARYNCPAAPAPAAPATPKTSNFQSVVTVKSGAGITPGYYTTLQRTMTGNTVNSYTIAYKNTTKVIQAKYVSVNATDNGSSIVILPTGVDPQVKKSSYTPVYQEGWSMCGPASVATTLRWEHGKTGLDQNTVRNKLTNWELRNYSTDYYNYTNVNSRRQIGNGTGTMPDGVIRMFKYYNYTYKRNLMNNYSIASIQSTIDGQLKAKKRVIACVSFYRYNTEPTLFETQYKISGSADHWVTIIGYNNSAKVYYIADTYYYNGNAGTGTKGLLAGTNIRTVTKDNLAKSMKALIDKSSDFRGIIYR